MKLDSETHTLRFASAEELDSFHRELTILLREVTVSVTGSTKDAVEARDRAKEVLREFRVVARLINTLRKNATHSDPRAADT